MRRTYTILVAVVALLVVTLGYAALATRTGHPSQRSSHPGATAGRTPLPAEPDLETISEWSTGAHRRHWGWA